MLNTFIPLIKCVHCPLSICSFSGMFFCGALANFSINSFTRFHFPALPSCCIWRKCVPKSLNSYWGRSTEKSIRQAGLRLVYYKQRLRRLSANKRKLVWKVLQTRLTLFVFFLCLSFGLCILKSSLVRPVLGNIKYKNNFKKNSVNCHFIFSCTLVRWFILVCTVAWPDSNYTRAFITHHSV